MEQSESQEAYTTNPDATDDLVCTCGKCFDFSSINGHIEEIRCQTREYHDVLSSRMQTIDRILETSNYDPETVQASIQKWRDNIIQFINETADTAVNNIEGHIKFRKQINSIKREYDQLLVQSTRLSHFTLNRLVKLRESIDRTMEAQKNLPEAVEDGNILFEQIISKLKSLRSESMNIETSSTPNNIPDSGEVDIDVIVTTSNDQSISCVPVLQSGSPVEVSTTPKPSSEVEEKPTDHGDYDKGLTRLIERTNPIIIQLNDDQNAGTICCHDNRILYNDYDPETNLFHLTWIPNLTDSKTKYPIDWPAPEAPCDVNDDQWIQDIVYFNEIPGYLLLNRTRLRLFDENTRNICDFQTFPGRTMKRLVCSPTHLYLVAAQQSTSEDGDEIIVMNDKKEEKACKSFREIMPLRINRGVGASCGQISDIAISSNQYVAVTYRFLRRREVGVCICNVSDEGRKCSAVKILSLQDCWDNNLPFTPRIDWCEKLKTFILIEYVTSHLVLLDETSDIKGECIFTHSQNRKDSPLNLSISNNNWICTRYKTSITVDRITE